MRAWSWSPLVGVALWMSAASLAAAQPSDDAAETNSDSDSGADESSEASDSGSSDSGSGADTDDWDLDAALAEEDGEGAESDDEWDFDAALADADGGDGAEDEEPGFFARTTFSLTSTTIAQYRINNFNTFTHDDGYLSIWERLEVAAQSDPLRVSARLDAFIPLLHDPCPEVLDPSVCLQTDVRLERFSASYADHGLTLELMDSYAVLGRGLALSLRRVDLLGVDNSLRGGQVAYRADRVYARLLGGAINPQNLDPQTLTIRTVPADRPRAGVFSEPDLRDWVVGGEAGVLIGPDAELDLGFHANRVFFARNVQTGARTIVDVGGWHLSAPSLLEGKLALYTELNLLARESTHPTFAPTESHGHAWYSSAQLALDRWTFLLEWKDYNNFRVAEFNTTGETHRIYGAAPTFEPTYERPRGLHQARGGRLQVDYAFRPSAWSLSTTALAYGFSERETDPFDGILVTHGYFKLQKVNDEMDPDAIGWTFELIAGARRESYLETPLVGDIDPWGLSRRVIHAQLDAGIVVGDHSFELSLLQRFERWHTFSYNDFMRGSVSLTYSYKGRFRIVPALHWNTENASRPSLYPGIEARVDFLSGSFVRVFGGRTPGGQVCSGGVCRDLPPFEGVLMELVLRL